MQLQHSSDLTRVSCLLHFSNELRKSDKMRGMSSILAQLRNEFNKLNNTGARMIDSIYHMALRLLKNRFFARTRQEFAIFYVTLKWASLRYVIKINLYTTTTSCFSILLHGFISLQDATSCDKDTLLAKFPSIDKGAISDCCMDKRALLLL